MAGRIGLHAQRAGENVSDGSQLFRPGRQLLRQLGFHRHAPERPEWLGAAVFVQVGAVVERLFGHHRFHGIGTTTDSATGGFEIATGTVISVLLRKRDLNIIGVMIED